MWILDCFIHFSLLHLYSQYGAHSIYCISSQMFTSISLLIVLMFPESSTFVWAMARSMWWRLVRSHLHFNRDVGFALSLMTGCPRCSSCWLEMVGNRCDMVCWLYVLLFSLAMVEKQNMFRAVYSTRLKWINLRIKEKNSYSEIL